MIIRSRREIEADNVPISPKIFCSGGQIDPSQSKEQKAKDVSVILNTILNNLCL